MSLRKYLLISILLIISTVGGLTIWSSYRESIYEVEEVFDAQLASSARMMLGLTLTELGLGNIQSLQSSLMENRFILNMDGEEAGSDHKTKNEQEKDEELYEAGHYYESKLTFQVWDRHGNMVLRSANAPLQPLSDIEQGYSNQLINNVSWRVFGLWNSDRHYRVQTAERYDVRLELVEKITQRLILPFLLLLPILAWLLWIAVGRGLQPLNRIADEVKSRDENYLDEIDESRVPTEVQPMVRALNRLFEKIKYSFEKERRFTSDAAHELRTPLAALKTHAQLAQSASNDEDRKHALSQLNAGVDRASHVVDQLLALTRLEPGANHQQAQQMLDLHQLCVAVVAELIPMAQEKNIEVMVDDAGELLMKGNIASLSMLVRNLVDNAIRYSHENGEVRLSFQLLAHYIQLRVIDDGPGIAENERDKVFQRFYRGEGLQQSGCGIGLSIVRQIAELHGADIQISESEQGGLQVAVSFPKS
ncbi:MAG: ATP-binding protein [Gammaproteobacteria bacterium]|nr:ATP-binding protein [Gammaproteobacteria bacterium]